MGWNTSDGQLIVLKGKFMAPGLEDLMEDYEALCQLIKVGVAGFEPATPCSQSRYTNRTVLYPELIILCGERGIRTPGSVTRTAV